MIVNFTMLDMVRKVAKLFHWIDFLLNPVCTPQERDVSREVRDLFLSQTVGKKGRLPNFQTMKTEELEAGGFGIRVSSGFHLLQSFVSAMPLVNILT